jgi:O-succinylbenzoic acid--CoA ligase
MRELVAVRAPGSATFVELLQRTWDDGDALLPVDPRLPDPAFHQLIETLAPSVLVDEDGHRTRLRGGRPVEHGDALVVATSGSTGAPKGVIHTHTSVLASARASSARLGVDPDHDRWLGCLPVAHVGGLSVITRALLTGTALEVHPRFDPVAVDAAADRGATLISVVPTALARIDATRWRRLVVGGSAPPSDLPDNAVTSYGLTETGSACAYDGSPFDGVELRIADDGEIAVRGDVLLRAYRHDGGDRDPRDADGWFHTADAGRFEADGRLTVLGRLDDAIVTGGEKVWPEAVERVLAEAPGVAEVAVTGRPDPEWGQRVVALIVPADPAEPPLLDALREQVRALLPAYAAPRAVELVTSLPRTSLGKIRRREL